MAAKTRIKCPQCGEAFNLEQGATNCPRCKSALDLTPRAYIYLYRQGSPYGVAGGFGVFIDGQPYGHIGNKELLRIPVCFGEHVIHCAVGMSRKCRDMKVMLTAQNNTAYAKVYILPGFWANSFVVEPVDPSLLEL